MARAPGLYILDFDGTFTDVEREAIPFLAAYRRGLVEILDVGPLDAVWDRALAHVRRAPDEHGFVYESKIVAPSHADPYILATSVAHRVLEELSLSHRAPELEPLFGRAYAESDTVFRPDAGEVLEAVLGRGAPVYVVSNSHTGSVRKKLELLDRTALARLEVIGDAKKFHLTAPEPSDAAFEAVPETLDVAGLSRPIYLRRGRYYERLRAIWQATGTGPSDTLVCGDIFELDLALPAALGADVHLVGRSSTPAWEQDAVRSRGGSFSLALSGLLSR
ncbi:MAG: HAD family hydrolase [Sandaracinaceae bacterium]